MAKFKPGKVEVEEAAAKASMPGCEVEEPERSMEAAADVVEAIAVAETGSGWLWVPS